MTDQLLENELIGVCLISPVAIAEISELIRYAETFARPDCRKIYQAMLNLHRRGLETDIVSVYQELLTTEGEHSNTDFSWLSVLTGFVPDGQASTGNLTHKSGLLLQLATNRILAQVCSRALAELSLPAPDPFVVMDSITARIDAVRNRLFELHEESFAVALDRVADNARKAAESRNPITGIAAMTGDVDRWTKGFHANTLTVVAARPGMGKSAWLCQVAYNTAVIQGISTALFSLEMGLDQLAGRFIGIDTGLKNAEIQSGMNSFNEPVDFNKISKSSGRMGKTPLWVYDKLLNIDHIKARCRALVKKKGVKVILIDYLQLVKSGLRSTDKTAEVSYVSRELKLLSKELSVPVIALAQLSREVEKMADKRPELAHLNHSGSIEQDADTVIFLMRPGYYFQNNPDGSAVDDYLLQAIVAKNRNGGTHPEGKAIHLHYDRPTNRIKHYDDQPF